MLFKLASLITLFASSYLAAESPTGHLPLETSAEQAEEVTQTLPQQTLLGPIKDPNMLGVKITAKAAVVIDGKTGSILFEKNAHAPLPQASLTKIMTAITVLDQKAQGEDIVSVSRGPLRVQPFGADLGLSLGERISVYNLLRSLLMVSANDAAIALAEYTAGSEKEFLKMMNQKTRSLGLQNSQFQNTHGLDAENHYSTAYDLAMMSRYALEKNVYREISATHHFVYATSVRNHWLKNTNELLDYPYIDFFAGKTGFTDQAGECLMEAARDQAGHEIVIVILNSENRWHESKALADWTYRAYTWPE